MNQSPKSEMGQSEFKTVFVGRVEWVTMRTEREATDERYWAVGARVLRVLCDDPPLLAVGEEVRLHVHSIVEAFGADQATVVGKIFTISCLDGFRGLYEGPVWARPF